MKLAIFTDATPPQLNGVVVYLKDLISLLSKKGCDVTIVRPEYEDDENHGFRIPDVEEISIPSISLPLYPDLRFSLPITSKSFNRNFSIFSSDNIPHIVHAHTPGSIGLMGVWTAKRYHIPLVQTFHTYFTEPEYLKIIGLDKIGLHDNATLQQMLWGITSKFYNQSDLVLSGTKMLKNDLLSHGVNVPIKALPWSASKLDTIKSAKLPFRLPEKYLLYTGRISKEKNLATLISAFSLVVKKLPLLHLVIVGTGPQKTELEKMTRELSIEKNVIFTGFVENELLRKSSIIKDALLYVSASTSEMRPISVLEAMEAKVAVVGAKMRGVEELLEKRRGFLAFPDDEVDFAKKITLALTDNNLREEMIQNAYRYSEKNSLVHHTDSLLAEYEKLIKSNKLKNKNKPTTLSNLTKPALHMAKRITRKVKSDLLGD